jgi:hypothetical protein
MQKPQEIGERHGWRRQTKTKEYAASRMLFSVARLHQQRRRFMLQRLGFECALQTQSRETGLATQSEETISFHEVQDALISFYPFSSPLFHNGHCKSLPSQAGDINHVVAQTMTEIVSAN